MITLVRNLVAAAAVIAVATLAMGVEAPAPSRTALTLPGHNLGIGEQQVFVIDRMADLNLRFRDDLGRVHATHYRSHLTSSIAFTVEGVSSSGALVLGLALPGPPQPQSQSSQAPAIPAVTPLSPPPSPELDQAGTLPTQKVADFSPASIFMSGLPDDLLNSTKPWKSLGSVSLPFGRVSVNMVTTRAAAAAADQATTVAHLISSGSADIRGKLPLKGVGQTSFNGSGRATGSAYVDAQNQLLLGMTLTTFSQGNARARRQRGSYDLHVQLAIKLVHYVPGVPLLSGGSAVASGHLGTNASPDMGNISTAPANPVSLPAPTDTGFVGSPLPTLQPSALPEASLPPIPLPMDSTQPIVSPPPGPTPTQTPFRY